MNAGRFFDHWNKVWKDRQCALPMVKDEHVDFHPAERYHRNDTPKFSRILRHILERQIDRGEMRLCPNLSGMDRPMTDRPPDRISLLDLHIGNPAN